MRVPFLLSFILSLACDPKAGAVDSSSCTADQVFVADACLECGDAGGCADTGAACLESCSDSGFDCQDGVRTLACD